MRVILCLLQFVEMMSVTVTNFPGLYLDNHEGITIDVPRGLLLVWYFTVNKIPTSQCPFNRIPCIKPVFTNVNLKMGAI